MEQVKELETVLEKETDLLEGLDPDALVDPSNPEWKMTNRELAAAIEAGERDYREGKTIKYTDEEFRKLCMMPTK